MTFLVLACGAGCVASIARPAAPSRAVPVLVRAVFTARDELDKLRWDGDAQFKTDRRSRVLKPRTDMDSCPTHARIPNFPNGNGYIVQCADGEWSHSGGLSGACSYHGVEQ